MSFMPLSGCTFLAQRLSTAIDHLHLHNFACQSILPRLHCQTLSWVDSLEHLLASKYLHTSTAKTGTEDIHLITFTPQIWNLELKTFAWQPSLVQLHLRNNACIAPVPTLNCTQPLDHMHLRSFTCQQIQGYLQWETWSWKPSLDKIHLTIFALSENPHFWNAASSSLLSLATTHGGCTPANLSLTLLTLIHLLKDMRGHREKPQTTWNFFSLLLLKETLLVEIT